jgi:hypothetical protein
MIYSSGSIVCMVEGPRQSEGLWVVAVVPSMASMSLMIEMPSVSGQVERPDEIPARPWKVEHLLCLNKEPAHIRS